MKSSLTLGCRARSLAWLVVILLVCPLLVPAAKAQAEGLPTSDHSGDGCLGVLRNPDFEEGFSVREAVEVTVAEGWEPWWVEGTEEEQSGGVSASSGVQARGPGGAWG